MTGAPLTDGMLALQRGALTELVVWEVAFMKWSHHPRLAVPPDTDLNEVEALARTAMVQELSRHGGDYDYGESVATTAVQSVTRVESVYVHPAVG